MIFRIFFALLSVALAQAAWAQPQVPGVIVAEAQIQSFPLSSEALGNARANEAVDMPGRPWLIRKASIEDPVNCSKRRWFRHLSLNNSKHAGTQTGQQSRPQSHAWHIP